MMDLKPACRELWARRAPPGGRECPQAWWPHWESAATCPHEEVSNKNLSQAEHYILYRVIAKTDARQDPEEVVGEARHGLGFSAAWSFWYNV